MLEVMFIFTYIWIHWLVNNIFVSILSLSITRVIPMKGSMWIIQVLGVQEFMIFMIKVLVILTRFTLEYILPLIKKLAVQRSMIQKGIVKKWMEQKQTVQKLINQKLAVKKLMDQKLAVKKLMEQKQ